MTLCKRRLVDDVSGRPRHSARARGRGATVASAMRVEHAAAFGVGVAAAAYALGRVSSSRVSVVKRAWLGLVVARHPESSSSRERDRVAAEPDPPDGVPADYLCPIGGHVMLDPVLCGCSPSCGKSFDRRSIERWILEGSPSCPVTSRPLDLDKLYPNRTLRSAVETHLAENDVPADVMPPPRSRTRPRRSPSASSPEPPPPATRTRARTRRRPGRPNVAAKATAERKTTTFPSRSFEDARTPRWRCAERSRRRRKSATATTRTIPPRTTPPGIAFGTSLARRASTAYNASSSPPARWRRSWTSFARRTAAGENTPSGTPPPVPGPFAVPHPRERERRP